MRTNRCGSSAGLFYVHGCFHSDSKVTPSDPESSSKERDEEERACSTELRGEICTANHSDFYIQVY